MKTKTFFSQQTNSRNSVKHIMSGMKSVLLLLLLSLSNIVSGQIIFQTGGVVTFNYNPDKWSYTTVSCASTNRITSITLSMQNTTIPAGLSFGGVTATSTFTSLGTNPLVKAFIFNPGITAIETVDFVKGIAFQKTDNALKGTVSIVVDANPTSLPSGATITTWAHPDGTTHYYVFVSGLFKWDFAYNKAKSFYFQGKRGYLATITSAAEDATLVNISTSGGWSGGLRSSSLATINDTKDTISSPSNILATPTDYSWACGPEVGFAYYHGPRYDSDKAGTLNGAYSHWLSSEPNNTTPENCMQINVGTSHTWNDLAPTNSTSTTGYIIEFGGSGEPYLVGGATYPSNTNYVTPSTLTTNNQWEAFNPINVSEIATNETDPMFKTIRAAGGTPGYAYYQTLKDAINDAANNDVIMALDNYTISGTDAVVVINGKTITLTTAETATNDAGTLGAPYRNSSGLNATRATLIRGRTGHLLSVAGTGQLIVKDIILDGNRSNGSAVWGNNALGSLIYAQGAGLTVSNVVLKNNITTGFGAAINTNKIVMSDSEILNNETTASGGGGLYLTQSTGNTIDRSTFVANKSISHGGGINFASTSVSAGALKINNSLIAHNEITGTNWGAGLYNTDSYITNVELINSTIVLNKTGTEGTRTGLQGAVLKNCVIWGNNNGAGTAIYQAYNVNATYCGTTSGGFAGTGTTTNHYVLATTNTAATGPNFANPGTTGVAGYIAGSTNYALTYLTPFINRGNTADAPTGTDLAGKTRIFGGDGVLAGVVDMGAYEQTVGGSRPVIYSAGAAITNTSDARLPAVTTWNLVYYAASDVTFSTPLTGRPSVEGNYVIRAEDANKHWVASNVYTFNVTPIRYVTVTGAGFKTGISWADAADGTQIDALTSEAGVKEIWIATGIHILTTSALVTTPNIKVYGGFAGTETGLTGNSTTPARNWTTNVTTLQQTGAHRVFDIQAIGVIVDGLTITGGNSSLADGIGIHVSTTGSNAIIQNCIITDNIQTTLVGLSNGGGGIYVRSGATGVEIRHCKITNNKVSGNGAGIYLASTGTLVSDCEISYNNNTGASGFSKGSGIAIAGNNTVTNCRIFENYATNYNDGTGIYIGGGTVGLENLLVYRNRNGFGAITAGAGTINGKNLTVVSNETTTASSTAGLGLNGSSTATIYNSIFAFNNSPNSADINRKTYTLHLYNSFYGSANAAPSTNTNNVTTVGVITDHFVSPIAYNVTSTGLEDFSLKPTSALINRGQNANAPSGTDLAGNLRIWNPSGKADGVVDVGAYEQTAAGVRNVTYTPTSFVYNATAQIPTVTNATTDGRLPAGNWAVTVYTNAGFTTVTTTPTIPATYYVKSTDSNGHWTETGSSYTITPKTYTVRFDPNTGVGAAMTDQSLSFSSTATTTLTANTYTKAGYTFVGWNTAAAGSGTAYLDKYPMAHNTFATQAGTLTLYAQWIPNSYSVLFDGNTIDDNGRALVGLPTLTTTTVSATYDAVMPAAGSAPTLAGYTFAGYYDVSAATGGIRYYTSAMASARTWNKTTATILYARWTALTYTVTLDGNGGTGGAPATVTATIGANMPNLTTAPTGSGLTFAGYYDTQATTGGTQYYSNTLASTHFWDKTAATTLYARWTANSTLISLNGNTISSNGSNLIGTPTTPVTSVSATYGAAMPSAGAVPTLIGYTFAGYYDTQAATGGTQYYDSAMASATSWTNAAVSITLYARWTAGSSTVTLDTQGGDVGVGTTSVTATYGANMPTATAPIRAGYTFAGYYTSANGVGTQYYNSAMESVAVWDKTATTATLYAYWAGTIRYVTLTGAGTKTGTSWTNAGDGTQIAALANSLGVTEVWIAQGEHNITVEQVITNTGIKIYGGFVGGELAATARNSATNITTIKQIATAPAANTRVFNISAADVILDGLTITGGNYMESGSTFFRREGGGILWSGNNGTLSHCIVTVNNAATGGYGSAAGGGISITGTGLTIDYCEVTNNTISRGNTAPSLFGAGVGVFATGVTIKNSKIANNSVNGSSLPNNNGTVLGGGIYIGASTCIIESCNVESNTLASSVAINTYVSGAGIYVNNNLTGVEINNTLVVKNVSKSEGGGIYVYSTTASAKAVKIRNTLIANNEITSAAFAAGLFNNPTYRTNVEIVNSTIVFNKTGTEAVRTGLQGAILKNCVVWGNASGSGSASAQGFDVTATYCATVSGGLTALGSTSANQFTLAATNIAATGPNFVNPGTLGSAGYTSGITNYALTFLSPLINRGNNTDAPVGTDIAGKARIFAGTSGTGVVDIGAYEQTTTAKRAVTYNPTTFVYNATPQKPTATDATGDLRTPAGTWSATTYFDAGFTSVAATPTAPATYYVKSTDDNGHWTEAGSSYTIEAKTYTVRFNANGGSGTMANQPFSFSSIATTNLSNNTFTRAGYVFTGWATSAGGTTVVYNNLHAMDHSTFAMQGGTLDLYAVWVVTPVSFVAQTATPTNYGSTGYSYNIFASSGSGSFAFALASGSLPAGFTLSSTGALTASAVTANAGTYTLSIKVTDVNTSTATANVTLVINPKTITLTTTATKSYDGSNTLAFAEIPAGSRSWTGPTGGIVGSEVITLAGLTGSPTYSASNAHNFTLVASVGTPTYNYSAGAVAGNYTITLNITGSITPKAVTLNSTATKTYDGTNTLVFANLATTSWTSATSGLVAGQTVNLTALTGATYNSVNVHSTLTASSGTPTYTYGGGAIASNYSITLNITGTIIQKAITLSTTATKVYDGNNAVAIGHLAKSSWTSAENITIVSGDVITLSALNSATYTNANYHTATVLSAQGSVTWTGTNNNNYNISFSVSTGAISKATVYVNALPQTKVYGSAEPTFTYVSTPATLIGSSTFTGTLARAVGTAVGSYAINIGTLSAGNNYAITYTGADLTIIPAGGALTIDPITSIPYNGLAQQPAVVVKNAGGTTLTLTTDYTVTYNNNTNAGTASVTVTGANGYLGALGSASFTISPKVVTISTTATKEYDGNNIVTVGNLAASSWTATGGLLAGHTIAVSNLGGTAYNSANVHTSLATVAGTPSYTYSGGASASNYNITLTITGSITKKAITISSTSSKVYDGNAVLSLAELTTTSWSGTIGGIIGGETITLTVLSGATYSSANVHTSVALAAAGTPTYIGAGNYTVTLTITGSITAKAVRLTTTATKIYDGSNTLAFTDIPAGSRSWTGIGGLVASETVSITALSGAQYVNNNVHLATVITTKGTPTFTGAGNYNVTLDITGNITAKSVTLTTTATKVYDGNNIVAIGNLVKTSWVNADNSSIVSGDVITLNTISGATYTNANYHTAIPLSAQGIKNWIGVNYLNYNITFTISTGAIDKATIQVFADARSKVSGASDPALTYISVPATLLGGNSWSGTLSRATGETVGSYAISQNTLNAGPNYTIVYTGANFTISPSAGSLTVSAIADVTYNGYAQEPSVVVKNGTTTLAAADYDVSYTYNTNAGVNTAIVNIMGKNTYAGASGAATFTILPKAVTLTPTATKVYDGNNVLSLSEVATTSWTNTNGVLSGDNITLVALTGAQYTNTNVHGTAAITVKGTPTFTGASNYTITLNVSGNITKKNVTLTSSATKVYDASNSLVLANLATASWTGTTGGIVSGETITLRGLTGALYTNTNVHAPAVITAKGTPTYNPVADNYNVTLNITADITKKAVTLTTTATKVYDGNNTVVFDNLVTTSWTGTTGGLVSGQVVGLTTLTGAQYVNTNVHAGTIITTKGTPIFTATANNYTITLDITGSITQKAITLSTTATKVYDGNNTVTIGHLAKSSWTTTDDSSIISGDVITLSTLTSATYSNVNVHTAALLSPGTRAWTGNNYGNYNIILNITSGAISKATVYVNALPQTKVYGSAEPTFTYVSTPATLIGSSTFTGTLARAVGTAVGRYAIEIGSLSAGGNYAITYTGADLTIIPAGGALTIDPITTITYNGLVQQPTVVVKNAGGTTLTLTTDYTVTYNNNTNAGTASVTVNGVNGYAGALGVASFTINPKVLTVTGFGITKVYDTNNNVTTFGSPTFVGLIGGQTATVNTFGVTATYDNANVGTGKTITITSGIFTITPGTALASNYTVTQPTTGITGVISVLQIPKPSITGTLTYNGSVQSPTIPVNAAYNIMGSTQTNAGAYNAIVTLVSTTNYQWADGTTAALTLPWTIGTKTVTIAGFNITKVYDNTTPVTNWGSLSFNGLAGSETANVVTAGVMADYNTAVVGTAKPISYTGLFTMSGGSALASNYNITQPTGLTGTVTPSTSSLTIDPITAVPYNGAARTPTIIVRSGGTTLNLTTDYNVTYTYNTNAGIATVYVTGVAGYAGSSASANFTISPATVTVTNVNITKIYDGNTTVTTFGSPTFAGLVLGQTATVNTFGVTATYNNVTAGIGKAISYTGTFTMSGGSAIASNYVITQPSGLTGTITALPIIKPVISGTLTYNGLVQSPTIATNAAYNITGNTQTNAGSYNVTVTLISTTNYQWADGTATALTLPWTISKALVAVIATPQAKAFGVADPILTYTSAPNPLIAGNSFGGALTRVAGETLGTYAITQGSLSVTSNYTMTYTGANLTIIPSTGALSIDPITPVTYNGLAQTPPIVVKNTTGVVVPSTDYTVAYSHNINAGSATVIITGTGSYAGVLVVTFTILPKPITLTSTVNKTYDGTKALSIEQMAKVSWHTAADGLIDGQTITLATLTNAEYTTANVHDPTEITTTGTPSYSYSSGAITSNYTITLKTIGGIAKAPLIITAKDQIKLTDKKITPAATEFTATGLQNDETIGRVTLTCPQFSSITAALGTYPITVSSATGGTFNANNYDITYVKGTLTVYKSLKHSTISVTPPADVFYDGVQHKEKPIVRDGTTFLSEDVDYSLSYSADVVNVGTVTVTITGMGAYRDSRTTTYKIKPQVYTVIFESNGGTIIANQKIEKGTTIPMPENPSRYRYLFDGWYKDIELTQVWNFNTDVVKGDVILYAHWNRPEITVYFDQGEGKVTYTQDTVLYGDTYAKFPEVHYMNYPFLGWHNDEGFVVNITDTLFTTATEITLHARFRTDFQQPEKNNHVITPNEDGLNDRLYIKFLEADNTPINNATVYIYNRSGNLIYKLEDYQKNDGDFDGNKLPSGTYILLIHYQLGTTKKVYQGSVSIMRDL